MKQETRYKLKRYVKYAYYGVIALCWLMALVGVSAYAIYQCKQLADYQEPKQQERVRYNAYDNNLDLPAEQLIYVSAQTQNYYNKRHDKVDYSSYIVPTSNRAQYSESISIHFRGTFNSYVNQDLRLYVSYVLDNRYGYDYLYFKEVDIYYDTSTYFKVWDNNVTPVIYNSFDLLQVDEVTSVYYSTDEVLTLAYPYGLFDYLFVKVFDNSLSTAFTIDFTTANFTQLLSYARVGIYDFIYSGTNWGQVLEIPVIFTYNNQLYEKILVETDNIVYYLNDANTEVSYDEITGSATNYINGATHIAFLKYGGSYDTTYPDGTNNPNYLYPFMIGDITEIAYKEVAYYKSFSSHMRPVYNMAKGWNTYRNISYRIQVSNADLDNVPFPASSTDTHYPLSNLTIEELLNYVAVNDTLVYGLNGTSDVGLGNVFTLMGNAFSGLTSLMAIQIIPGITLGLLLFMPLVITIIIVILRLVKK